MWFWLSAIILLVIACGIAFFIWFAQRKHYYADPLVSYLVPAAVIAGVVWIFVGALAAGLAAQERAEELGNYVTDSEHDLVALATTSEKEGNAGFLVFVGWGYEGETRMVYWTQRDEEGIVTLESMEAKDAMVREVTTEPRVIREHPEDDTFALVPWVAPGAGRTILEVPVGTLTQNYEFQP